MDGFFHGQLAERPSALRAKPVARSADYPRFIAPEVGEVRLQTFLTMLGGWPERPATPLAAAMLTVSFWG